MADSIYKTHKPESGGDLYLKIKDGETVKLRIASEPAIFESVSEREGKEVITTRYAWTVWNQDKQIAQILQQSATFFSNLAGLAQDEEWGDPLEYDIKISRSGSAFNDTKYTLVPSANREPLNNEARESIKAVDLLEKIKASPFSQHVFWLSDWDKEPKEPPQAEEKSKAAPSKSVKKDDVVIEDIGEEPINLDDIPF